MFQPIKNKLKIFFKFNNWKRYQIVGQVFETMNNQNKSLHHKNLVDDTSYNTLSADDDYI